MEEWRYSKARDLDLTARQSFQSVRREVGLPSALLIALRWLLVRAYLRLAHRLEIRGRENLPRTLPFILVANHASHLDALALAGALPMAWNFKIFPVAAGDTFFETPAAAAFASLFMNALPLWRRHCGAHALEDLRKRLVEEPCGYVLFPEGTRSRTEKMAAFKPGVGRLVAGTAVPVIPCHLEGTYAALPPQCRWPRPVKIRLRLGTPLVFASAPNDREGWQKIAATLETAVRELGSSSTE
jgi:1-acyl-sn-glycerol-3-phosphate acyltransferase